MYKSAIKITLLNIIARALHFLFYIAIGNIYGANQETDFVLFVLAPLIVVMSVITTVSEIIVIPVIHRAKNNISINIVKNILLMRGLIVVIPLTVLSMIITHNFIDSMLDEYVIYILFPIPIISMYTAVVTGALNAEGLFKRASIIRAYGGVLAILTLIVLPINVISLALSFLAFELGRFIGAIVTDSLSFKDNVKVIKNHVAINELTKWFTNKAILQTLGSLLHALIPLIDIYFASQLGTSSITQIELASKMWNVIPLILSGYTIMIYVEMSKEASVNKLSGERIKNIAINVGLASLIISLCFIYFSEWIMSIIFGYGYMKNHIQESLATVFKCYVIGATPFMVSLVYIRALASEGKIGILIILTGINLFNNIWLNLLLIKYYGLNGIALATSISYLVGMVLILNWPGLFNDKVTKASNI